MIAAYLLTIVLNAITRLSVVFVKQTGTLNQVFAKIAHFGLQIVTNAKMQVSVLFVW